ncbi:MAG: hypothetical protein Q9217_001653 [Psora testacea]
MPFCPVLDDFEPLYSITPYYPSTHKTVKLGNDLKPSAVRSPPNINMSSISPTRTQGPNTTFTIVLTDPDATSRAEPVQAQMCHWILTNITADNSGNFELEPYIPPSPPSKTGYHRYVFVLLEPGADSDPSSLPKKPKDRPHWGYGKIGAGVREWADENGLIVVGK